MMLQGVKIGCCNLFRIAGTLHNKFPYAMATCLANIRTGRYVMKVNIQTCNDQSSHDVVA